MEKLKIFFIWLTIACVGTLLTVSCNKEEDWDPGSIDVTADFDFSLSSENAPTILTTQNKSTNGFTYLWKFAGGTPATSMEKEPKVAYKAGGTYDIFLSVGNGKGYDTIRKSVTIKDPLPVPVSANFSFAFANGNDFSPAGVNFTDKSSNPTAWAWTFTGGSPATSDKQNPGTVTYAAGGKYPIKLKTSNATGSAEMTDSIKVYPGELVCSNDKDQKWIAPLMYPGVGEIGNISIYLDKARIDKDQPDKSLSSYKIFISGAAMTVITKGKTTTDLVFPVPASWDWTWTNATTQSLDISIYYKGAKGGVTAKVTSLESTKMNLGNAIFDSAFSNLINSVDPSGTLLQLLSQPHEFSKVKP